MYEVVKTVACTSNGPAAASPRSTTNEVARSVTAQVRTMLLTPAVTCGVAVTCAGASGAVSGGGTGAFLQAEASARLASATRTDTLITDLQLLAGTSATDRKRYHGVPRLQPRAPLLQPGRFAHLQS